MIGGGHYVIGPVCMSVTSDFCKSNQLISFKLGVTIGPTTVLHQPSDWLGRSSSNDL